MAGEISEQIENKSEIMRCAAQCKPNYITYNWPGRTDTQCRNEAMKGKEVCHIHAGLVGRRNKIRDSPFMHDIDIMIKEGRSVRFMHRQLKEKGLSVHYTNLTRYVANRRQMIGNLD